MITSTKETKVAVSNKWITGTINIKAKKVRGGIIICPSLLDSENRELINFGESLMRTGEEFYIRGIELRSEYKLVE